MTRRSRKGKWQKHKDVYDEMSWNEFGKPYGELGPRRKKHIIQKFSMEICQ